MKKIKFNLSTIFLVLLAAVLTISHPVLGKDLTAKELVEEAKAAIKTISISDANAMYGKSGVVFLDVREADEFKQGHVPGAINIPRGLLEFQIEQQIPDKNTTIVIYCRSGSRSALASATLMKMGYKGVLNVDGGWKAWLDAGYPAE
jgi:rhodanese-related sulfurtransferase